MKKYLSLFLIFLTVNIYAIDKEAAKIFSQLTDSYKDSIKSKTPNKAVVFISSRIEPDFMDLKEVNIDNIDLTDGQIVIDRPTNSSNIRNILECRSEQGSVTIQSNTIIVNTLVLPIRVLCTGADGNYREAYSTFENTSLAQ